MPSPELNPDKSFYFTDAAYSDMRELACHERPVVFLLHYLYGIPIPYHLLLDRFFFALNESSKLEALSNALHGFFLDKGICRPITENLRVNDLASVISSYNSERSAFILPTIKIVANETLVTAVVVELFGDRLLVSSLRGDDFYVRRPESLESLGHRLATKDGRLETVKIDIPHTLLAPDGIEIFRQQQKSCGLRAASKAVDHFKKTAACGSAKVGCEALLAFVKKQETQLDEFEHQVAAGFHNVLLAKVLWPMTFCYLPYVIASRRINECEKQADAAPNLQLKITEQSGLAAKLGHLYARGPNKTSGTRFFNVLHQVIDDYRKLESLILSGRPPSMSDVIRSPVCGSI